LRPIREKIPESESCDFSVRLLGGVDETRNFWVLWLEAIDLGEGLSSFIGVSFSDQPGGRFGNSEEEHGGEELQSARQYAISVMYEQATHSEYDLESHRESPGESRLYETKTRTKKSAEKRGRSSWYS
jgi:hypothetical protein